MRQETTDPFHDCGFQSEVTFQGWNLGAFDTWDILRAVHSEASFVQKGFHHLDGVSGHELEKNLGKQQMHWLNFNLLSCFQSSRILFFFPFFFSFTESVLVLALLEVDYSVARRNEPMMQFPYSVHVSPCACMTGKMTAQLFTSSHCHLSVHINTRINPAPLQP